MRPVLLDTHALLWYLTNRARLSGRALAAIEGAINSGSPIHVASVSLVEIVYLTEKGRLPTAVLAILDDALADETLGLTVTPLDAAVARALRQIPREAVPDMPDRIIAATALHLNVPLVTKDHLLHAADFITIW